MTQQQECNDIKVKNIFLLRKKTKNKNMFCICDVEFFIQIYIYTHNALECENSGPIWGEMTLKNSVFKIKTNAHEYEIDTING